MKPDEVDLHKPLEWNGMERSSISADLKQEANKKCGVDPISLVNTKAPLATPKSKRVMDQRRIWERR